MKFTSKVILLSALLSCQDVINAFNVVLKQHPLTALNSMSVRSLSSAQSSLNLSGTGSARTSSQSLPAMTNSEEGDTTSTVTSTTNEQNQEQVNQESIATVEETTQMKLKEPEQQPDEEEEVVDMKIPVIQRLSETYVTSVKTKEQISLSTYLQSASNKAMLVFGTYAADFNAIEYVQRLRYYLPQIQAKGVDRVGLILNCDADAAKMLVSMLDLETDATIITNGDAIDTKDNVEEKVEEQASNENDGEFATPVQVENAVPEVEGVIEGGKPIVVELFIDPLGEAGRKFGVGRGWRSNDNEMSPYVKLFGMLFGLGAWATLPAVIGGYIGNPFFSQPWIEDALTVGQLKGRWPDNALELDDKTGQVKENKFKTLPVVGEWERRPLELATLRLQNMVDVSIKYWNDLSPDEDALKAGVLTQLGGCVVVESKSGREVARWRDPGICAVANFENLLERIE